MTFYSAIADDFAFFVRKSFDIINKISISISRIMLFDCPTVDANHVTIFTRLENKFSLSLFVTLVYSCSCFDTERKVEIFTKYFDQM